MRMRIGCSFVESVEFCIGGGSSIVMFDWLGERGFVLSKVSKVG